MAIDSAARAALFELAITDSLLHTAMSLTVNSTRDEMDIGAFSALADNLKTYDRADVEWCLRFMNEHPELHDYWAATIHRLNADEFYRYLDRLDDLWERITSLPGVTAATTWSVLNGYRAQDPGTKRSHGTAAFMINAALLTSMKTCDFSPEESGVTTHTRYSAFVGESLDELTTAMIAFAIERAPDVDRIVEIILTENLWQPEALRYRLDRKLTATTEAEELAYPMIAKACDASPIKLDRYTTKYAITKSLTAEQIVSLNATHTNSMILKLVELVHSNDLESLRMHTKLITDYCSANAAFDSNTLDVIINDLRKLGKADLSVIDGEMLYRVGKVTSMVSLNSRTNDAALPKKNKHWTEYCESLRTAAAIGPENVQKYIADDAKRTIVLAVRHEAITHDTLVNVIEEAASHGALTEGFI
jgi:adenosine/AMP kinase